MFGSTRPARRAVSEPSAAAPGARVAPTPIWRRAAPLALVALLITAALGLAVPRVQRWLEARTPLPVGGRLLLPSEAGLVLFQLDDRQQRVLIPVGAGEMVTAAAWSPDGRTVAYSLFHRRPEDTATVSEVFVAPTDGGQSRPLAERDRPGDQLDSPIWSPDGATVLFSHFGLDGTRTFQRIERVSVATGERAVVLQDGYAPAIAPDGRQLAFLRDTRLGLGLWITDLRGGEPRALIPPGQHAALASPRFSPDGRVIAVAIVNSATASSSSPDLLGWLGPRPAYAHGQPWDIWLVDVGSGSARRLTHVNADDPTPAWSPDGGFIAFWGGNGLFLADVQSGQVRRVLEQGSYGPIDWAR